MEVPPAPGLSSGSLSIDAEQAFAAIERSNRMSRQHNQDMLQGNLEASAIVVAQSAAMQANVLAAQGGLPKDFSE